MLSHESSPAANPYDNLRPFLPDRGPRCPSIPVSLDPQPGPIPDCSLGCSIHVRLARGGAFCVIVRRGGSHLALEASRPDPDVSEADCRGSSVLDRCCGVAPRSHNCRMRTEARQELLRKMFSNVSPSKRCPVHSSAHPSFKHPGFRGVVSSRVLSLDSREPAWEGAR